MSDASAFPSLVHVGVSHHTTPLEIRERLAMPAEKAAALQATMLQPGSLRELAVLNTCNRVELYAVAENAEAVERLADTFAELVEVPRTTLNGCLHLTNARDSIQHLFEVASGLQSQLLGETEILGQVKDAYEAAVARHGTGPVLNRVFQKTFQAAKLVRTDTQISTGQVSVANVAVDLALKIFGTLKRTSILLVGAGDIGEKTAKAFQSRGAERLTVSSRRIERAMELATEFGAAALPFDQVGARLSDYDVVVGSTAAPDVVITHDMVAAAMKRRPARPLFCIDLALPRDFAASIAELDSVFLYNLDDLASIAEANLAVRRAEAARCRTLLAGRADALWHQISHALGAAPAAPGAAPAPPANPSTMGAS